MLLYEDAITAASFATPEPFVHTAYSGGISNLGYLREWVLKQVITIYGGNASEFDQPTTYSTTILRDFVHRSLAQVSGSLPTVESLGGRVWLSLSRPRIVFPFCVANGPGVPCLWL